PLRGSPLFPYTTLFRSCVGTDTPIADEFDALNDPLLRDRWLLSRRGRRSLRMILYYFLAGEQVQGGREQNRVGRRPGRRVAEPGSRRGARKKKNERDDLCHASRKYPQRRTNSSVSGRTDHQGRAPKLKMSFSRRTRHE